MSIIPRISAIMRYYGPGYCEVGWSFVPTAFSRGVRGESAHRAKNIERAVRRAKAQVRRKVMAAALDHLLTLTYRENMMDEERAMRDFERFARLMREKLPGWRYVAVWERQERGAIHWHLAVRGFQDVFLIRRLWRQVVGEGNIDVRAWRGGRGAWPRQRLAGYLAKYVGKALGEEDRLGRHRFRASLGIEVPEERRRFASVADVVVWFYSTGEVPGYEWMKGEGAVGWICSWA